MVIFTEFVLCSYRFIHMKWSHFIQRHFFYNCFPYFEFKFLANNQFHWFSRFFTIINHSLLFIFVTGFGLIMEFYLTRGERNENKFRIGFLLLFYEINEFYIENQFRMHTFVPLTKGTNLEPPWMIFFFIKASSIPIWSILYP